MITALTSAQAVRAFRRVIRTCIEEQEALLEDLVVYAAPGELAALAMRAVSRRLLRSARRLNINYDTFNVHMAYALLREGQWTEDEPEAYYEMSYAGCFLLWDHLGVKI